MHQIWKGKKKQSWKESYHIKSVFVLLLIFSPWTKMKKTNNMNSHVES
jgi:hypothetical protein